MKKMQIVSIISLVLCLSATTAFAWQYDSKLPVAGKTITTQDMQMKSLFTIYSFGIRAASPTCQTFSISDTKVIKEKTNGTWEEVWTIDACENKIDVPVTFSESANTFNYTVNPMKVKVNKK